MYYCMLAKTTQAAASAGFLMIFFVLARFPLISSASPLHVLDIGEVFAFSSKEKWRQAEGN